MSSTDKVFAGSVPKLYDEYLVPLIFSVYADDLARRVAALSPSDLLEIAAGTGAVTRAVAAAAACRCPLCRDRPQRAHARGGEAASGDDPRMTWRQADALALPFDDAAFDVVCCQFGAMFFPDRSQGYAEAKRVLKPDGTYVFNVWDRIEDNVFADEATVTLGKMFPDDPPLFMARTPHGYHDKAVIRGRPRTRGLQGHLDRDADSDEPRADSRIRRDRLLPGNTAARRDRGQGCEQASGRDRRRCRSDPKTPRLRAGRRRRFRPW